MIEIDLMGVLVDTPAVKALVAGRVFDGEADAETPPPYIVFHTIIAQRNNTLVNGASPLRAARIQVDCYAATKLAASDVGKAVMAAVVLAPAFSATVNGDHLLKDPETGLGRCVLDFSITQNEAR